MKILAIHGSPRTTRSMTRQLAGFVLAGSAESGAETEMIDLADYRILPCTACEACTLNGICVNDDDMPELLARINEADALILGSPVYIDNVTGQMKVFFDRLADAIHYQQCAGKYGCAVATTGESGGDEVVAYLNHVLNYLGVISVGGMSVATGGGPEAVDAAEPAARALGKKLADAVRNGYSDPGQETEIEGNRAYFKTIVEENRDFRPDEFERWVRMGWI
ncbi:NADPH-dependent FMN reductase [Methanoregula boonei 6A8]|jgi:multimeric flavodoxin WrbA|uniref:NADPH-dependent FMN reductase n=1 Tax=Methanoregula boonei (strain DSM 21154 / JCM 14090 / 6A8) TaxID=456442 RepID=A7IAN2_METB6|nr:flavodoxin family protein [Methanoregula boonei]ABS56793.1 NADPH-dependent FMN reductase [Methanoregula boonei 6A8]